MLNADEAELAAVRRAFCLLMARWRLTQGEVRRLLGVSDELPRNKVLPDVLNVDFETRVRLLLRLDQALQQLYPEADIGSQLRSSLVSSDFPSLDALHDLSALRSAIVFADEAGQVLPPLTSGIRPTGGRS